MGKKIETQEVYLAYSDDKPVGAISLGTKPADYYTDSDMNMFANPEAEALYVTSLAVLLEYHRQGIASRLMLYAENEAKSREIEFVRFDCKALDVKLVSFYRKRDYIVRRALTDDNDNYEPYFLMEKKIQNNYR